MSSKAQKFVSHQRSDGSVVYRRQLRINGQKIGRTFSRKADADRWYLEQKREKERIESGLTPQFTPLVLSEFVSEWQRQRKEDGKPASVWSTENARLENYILPEFGFLPLHKISTQQWEKFLSSVKSKHELSNATRNRIRALIHKLYKDALRRGIVGFNPISTIPKLKESLSTYDFFETKEECEAYLKCASQQHLGFFNWAMLSFNTGLRLGESLAITNSDVNLAKRLIHVWKTLDLKSREVHENRTKSNHERWLGINDRLFEALVEHRKISPYKKPGDPVVFDKEGGLMNEGKIRHIHERVCKRAGLKIIRPHDIRHTYASHYMMNEGNLSDLQKLLGHSSPQMTQRYAHLAPNYLASKANVVSMSWKTDEASVISLSAHQSKK